MLLKSIIAALLVSVSAQAGSLSFNGTTSYGRAGSAVVTAPPGTIIAWYKPAVSGTALSFVGLYNSGSTHQFRLFMGAGGNNTIQHIGASASTSASSTNPIAINGWNCGAGFFTSNTSRRSMLDGNAANAGTNSGNSGASTVNRTSIGVSDSTSPANFLNGLLGPFAIFNATLGDAEVLAICKGWGLRRFWMNRVLYVPYPEVGTASMDWHGQSFALTATTDSTDAPAVRP